MKNNSPKLKGIIHREMTAWYWGASKDAKLSAK
jgi:hypothetical protein